MYTWHDIRPRVFTSCVCNMRLLVFTSCVCKHAVYVVYCCSTSVHAAVRSNPRAQGGLIKIRKMMIFRLPPGPLFDCFQLGFFPLPPPVLLRVNPMIYMIVHKMVILTRNIDGSARSQGAGIAQNVWDDTVQYCQAFFDPDHPLSSNYNDMIMRIHRVFKTLRKPHPEWCVMVIALVIPRIDSHPLAKCELCPE